MRPRLTAPVWILALLPFSAACTEYDFHKDTPPDRVEAEEEEAPPEEDEPPPEEEVELASVKGRVCDLDEDGWVVGATAWTEYDDDGDGVADTRVEALTDEEGYFLLEDLPLGSYTIYVEKGSFTATFEVTLDEPGLTELAFEECLSAEDVNIAVVTGSYDSIQTYLRDLGVEFDTYNGIYSDEYLNLLTDLSAMEEYDIIFFNCGISDAWIGTSRESTIGDNIRAYVEGGGSIYASDWAFYFFEVGFPDAIDFYGDDSNVSSARLGLSGRLQGDVVDETMASILGSDTADLNYNLDAWAVVSDVKPNVDILVQGDPEVCQDAWCSSRRTLDDVPLAVRLPDSGNAIYTSFHNESQTTVDMEVLLEEIIMSL